MAERLQESFRRGKAEGRPLFIGYVTGGYPTPGDTPAILLAMEEGGADILELGVPFSDPLADGATIQEANEVAIGLGVTFGDCLAFVREARALGLKAPVLLMGYENPVLSYGEARAARDAAAAGADGFIMIDLPPEEATGFIAECRKHGLCFVPLVAPTTAEARIALLAGTADGFLYCVSVMGTTGKTAVNPEELPEFLARVRRHTDLPLAVGFGITTREHVVAVGKLAEAAVVGTAIIRAIDATTEGTPAERVRAFVASLAGD